jgi:Tfp pilus assembly protein PilO
MAVSDKRKLTILSGVFVLALAGLGTLTYFQFNKNADYRGKIEAKQRDADDAKKKIARIPAMRQQAQQLSEQVDRYASILPKEHEVGHDAFVETIARFARDLKIEILRADPVEREDASPKSAAAAKAASEKAAKRAFSEHSYHFELNGDFPNFLKFLNKIENWDRFLAVEEIEIRPLAAGNEPRAAQDKEIEAAKRHEKSIELVVTTYTHTPKTRGGKTGDK